MTLPIAPTMSVSSFFRNLPETLQQPTAMAMLGSVGAHLLLFATLPALTSQPNPEDELRKVQVVTLTPQEQGRLPQAPATSQLGLPPVPQSPSTKLNSPLTQPLPLDSAPLYKIPDLTTSTPALPPAPTIDWSKIFPAPTRIISPPAPPKAPAVGPTIPAATPSVAPTSTPTPTETPVASATNPSIPSLPPAAPIDPSGSPSAQASRPDSPSAPAAQPSATTSPRPIDRLLADNREMSELYARENFVFNTTGATDSEKLQNATQSFQDWFKKNITDKGIADGNLDERALEADLPYRSPTPLTEKYDPALVYVLLDPEGKLAANPAVLGRTGYRYLDLLAEKAIAQKVDELKPTGKYVIYKIKLTLKPLTPPAAPAS